MRIYPSTPIPQNSMLIKGETLSTKMKKAANPKVTDTGVNFSDTNIEYIDRTDNPPGANISDIINVENPGCIPIYMWYDFDDKTIYFKSNCKRIYLNNDSRYSFNRLKGCKEIRIHLYTSKLTSMDNMFSSCASLTSLDLSHFDTSKVINMYGVFSYCSSLTSLDLSSFDTSNVTSMYSMFNRCSSLTSLNLSSFNTSNVTTMDSMFSYCSSLTSLDLSHFDTSKVINMYGMFRYIKVNNIDLSFLNMKSVNDVTYMFEEAEIENITISTSADALKKSKWMFKNTHCTTIDLSNMICKNIEYLDYMFDILDECTSVSLPVTGDKLISAAFFMRQCEKITSIKNIYGLNTSNVTDMRCMFYNCSSLTSLDVSNFNTSKVINMGSMFSGCSSLTTLDVSCFDTHLVENMSYMFSSCSALTSLDLSSFNTSNVTTIAYMFNDCSKLTSLDLSHFDISNVTSIAYTFCNCINLRTLLLPNKSIAHLNDYGLAKTFFECRNLESLDLSCINTSLCKSFTQLFNQCKKLNVINYGLYFILSDELWSLATSTSAFSELTMFEICPANKPIGGNWNRGNWGGWNNSTFLKESTIIPGTEFRSFIGNDAQYFIRKNITGGTVIYPTVDNDPRIWTRYNSDQKLQMYYESNVIAIYLNEDCSGMFKNLPDLIEVDLSHQYFNYNGTITNNWKEMFANDPKLTSVKYPKNFDMTEEVYLTAKANDDTNPTWHMFYNSPNAPKPTGGWWDYGTFNDEGTFIKGADIDIIKFRSAFTTHSSTMTAFKKSDVPPANMVDVFDVSKDGNMAIMSWYDTTANIQYWYSENPMVFMDSDSSNMFELPSSNVCKSIDLSGLDTRKVTNMSAMFYKCNKLTSLDLSSFNTSKVTIMNSMFSNCSSLTSFDLSHFDTSNVTNMRSMFYGCSSSSLDLSNWNTSNVINMSRMFAYCRKISSLDLSHFDTSKVIDMSDMFRDCPELSSLNLSDFNTSNVTDMSNMFHNCNELISLDLSHFDMCKCKTIAYMFVNCMKLDLRGFENWNVSNLESMSYAFNRCELIESIDLSNWNTPKLRALDVTFTNCVSLKTLNLSNFNTSKVTNMRSLVSNCPMLESLDLSSFDTSNVEYSGSYSGMTGMFRGTIRLSTIIFSDKFVISDRLYNNTVNNNSYNPLYEIYLNCPANKPTGGNWDLGTWADNGTFIKNT